MRRWFKDRANAQIDALLAAAILAVALRLPRIDLFTAAVVIGAAATTFGIKKNPSPSPEYSELTY